MVAPVGGEVDGVELAATMMTPKSSEYLSDYDVRHTWVCDGCDYQFETLIRFNAAGA